MDAVKQDAIGVAPAETVKRKEIARRERNF
jgi:hypothetical protein